MKLFGMDGNIVTLEINAQDVENGDFKMTKETKKKLKEVRKYMNKLLQHLGHHCCATDGKEHNRILDILYELEDLK